MPESRGKQDLDADRSVENIVKRLTLCELFEWAVKEYGDRKAILYSEQKEIKAITFVEWKEIADRTARTLFSMGVRKGDRVAMISEKCYQMPLLFFSIWSCNAVAVPICETLTEESQAYILQDAQAKIALCSERLKKRVDRLAEWGTGLEKVMTYDEVLHLDVSTPCSNGSPELEDLSLLVYTSGSTGHPKGVMLSHKNMTVNSIVAIQAVGGGLEDVAASLLPYWHCFALSTEMFCPVVAGLSIYVARDKLDFQRYIQTVRPTIVLSVPRIAETIRASVLQKANTLPSIKKKLFHMSFSLARKKREKGLNLLEKPLFAFLDRVLLQKVRDGFGGRIRMFVGGGAPLDKELQDFFMDLGMPMLQGYGLTEASPVISANVLSEFQLGTSGKMMAWLTEELGGDFTFEAEDGSRGKHLTGELLVKGDCVMLGYWRNPEETAKTIENGWLHTKDMGYLNQDGYLELMGRKTSLVCLQNGEKFYPEVIEERIKLSPYISQCLVVGEGQSHCYALVNVAEEMLNGHPNDVMVAILRGEIQRLCAHMDRHMRPKDVLILPAFTQENGFLTGSLKVRRYKVEESFREQIEALYQG